MTDLTGAVTGEIDEETRLLAAIAYGEASKDDIPDEISGVAHAVANRARAWGNKSISALLKAEPDYAKAANGDNVRFNVLIIAKLGDINKDTGMKIAVNSAKEALKGEGVDPSNGAFWWDGTDFKEFYNTHPKVAAGFRFGESSHNIFGVKEKRVSVTIRWTAKNKKTGEIIETTIRGIYTSVWVSTAAYGQTIFWKYDEEYLTATGGKAYR